MWQYPNPYFIFRQSEMAHCVMICTNTSVCYGKYTSQRVDSSASVVFYYICMSVAHRAGHSSVPLLCPCCQYGMTTLIEVLHLPCPTSCNIGGGCVHWSSISQPHASVFNVEVSLSVQSIALAVNPDTCNIMHETFLIPSSMLCGV